MKPSKLTEFATWVFIIGAVVGSIIQKAYDHLNVPFWVIALVSLANIVGARLAISRYVRSQGGEQS